VFTVEGEDEGPTLPDEAAAVLFDLARFGVLGEEGSGRLADLVGLLGFLKADGDGFFSEDRTRLCDAACLLFASPAVPLCIAA
jgi:hypothetical protein